MKIKYLGTAAAEGVPGLFCNCAVCMHARLHKGKNIRTRSQAVVDDTLLIDFPCDTYLHVLRDGLNLRDIHELIITHAHSDHFYPTDFHFRMRGYSDIPDGNTLHVYGMNAAKEKIEPFLAQRGESDAFDFTLIEPYKAFRAGKYTVTPLKANHDPKSTPVIYIIQKDGKSMLYGNDTGYFPDETWDYLEKSDIVFDLVSLDSTMGFVESRNGHMGVSCLREVVSRMTDMGLISPHTKVVAQHFTHNAKGTYEDFKKFYDNLGIITAYDSLEVES